MKVLGHATRSGYSSTPDTFIVEISMDEIAKVANKSAYREGDELRKLLAVGAIYPIDEGYDFRAEIVRATQQMQAAYGEFLKATQTMTRFAALMAAAEERE